MKVIFEILTSIMTILAFFYAGKYKWWGWLLGLISEMMWNVIIVYQKMWGLLPQSIFLLIIYTYNMIKWYKRNKEEKEMSKNNKPIRFNNN